MHCHQYRLSLPSPTNVWIEMGVAEPGLQATDVLLFVFHTDKDDEPTELVTYTQHKVGEVSESSFSLIPRPPPQTLGTRLVQLMTICLCMCIFAM